MTSLPPQQCCLEGVKHEGEATGELTKIGETDVYVAYPKDKSTDHAVLIIPDAYGMPFINSQLIADQFAANGYFCVLADPYHGDPVPVGKMGTTDFDTRAWLAKHPVSRVDPVMTSLIQTLRSHFHVAKLGLVGYCFGGKYVVRFTGATGHAASAHADAGFTAHPSFVEAEELRALDAPLSIAVAETDGLMSPAQRRETEAILKELADGPAALAYSTTLYAHVSHGFAVRSALHDKREKYAKEQAFMQAVQWFNYHLKG